jgi:hypothetical protein
MLSSQAAIAPVFITCDLTPAAAGCAALLLSRRAEARLLYALTQHTAGSALPQRQLQPGQQQGVQLHCMRSAACDNRRASEDLGS